MKHLRIISMSMTILFFVALIVVYTNNRLLSADVQKVNKYVEDRTSGFTGQIVLDLNNELAKDSYNLGEKVTEYRSINSDVVGWIYSEDLKIDYPVLYSEDNKEYLRKNVYGDYDISGSIYLDANYNELLSPIKLIHGHNMNNGSMFGHVPEMLYRDNLDSMSDIIYYDDKGEKVFKIFSVFSVDAKKESFIINPNISVDEVSSLRQEYKDRSWVSAENIPESSELLILNTCWYGISGKEHFLHCIAVAARIR